MKTDLLVTWIKHCDYPLFRKFLKDYAHLFERVIIYWSDHNRFPYFDHFMHEAIKEDLGDKLISLDPIETDWGTEDWRNKSTNAMLEHSTSDWICSIEQDWFAKDMDKLLQKTQEAMKDADLIGWWQENNEYIHPSFWFIKRSMLYLTEMDFAAHGKHDHFGWITEDVKKANGKIVTTQDMGFEDFKDCFHLGGVNQNYLEGMKEEHVFHRPEIFYVYNHFSREADVKQDTKFTTLSQDIEKKLALDIDPLTSEWAPFFS